jgi:hypothetical protein
MRTFHRVEERRAGRAPLTETEDRLPPGQSIAVIAGLSALCWAVLISIVMALHVMML